MGNQGDFTEVLECDLAGGSGSDTRVAEKREETPQGKAGTKLPKSTGNEWSGCEKANKISRSSPRPNGDTKSKQSLERSPISSDKTSWSWGSRGLSAQHLPGTETQV